METITRLAPAEREEQLWRWGLDPSSRWSGVERAGHVQTDNAETEFLRDGGWGIVSIKDGDSGLASHRGVLHPDEYVDHERLVGLVEDELGFSFDDVHAVYRQGRLSDEQRALRDRLDARLLELSRAGANMSLLGRVLGLKVESDGHCWSIRQALARARAAEAVAS